MTATAGTLELDRQAAPTRAALWDSLRWAPLAVMLTLQVVLSVRFLKGAPIPSGDEGRYIYAGHQLIYEFWHGGGSPYYETYFSGAPVLFPVLAAMVDHVSGLTGVRLMSLGFSLTTTSLLDASARRLFGYWPGVVAAGLFAGFAFTQDLGVYGTYDGMSLMLTALAAYCAVRTEPWGHRPGKWLIATALVMLAANAVKYVTVAFDPAVIALAAYRVRDDGWREMLRRAVALGLMTASLLALTMFLAGGAYLQGAMYSTFARNSGFQAFLGGAKLQASHTILAEGYVWIGLIIAMAAAAMLCSLMRGGDRARTALLAMLVFAGVLVTLEALKLHSDQSMRKHDDFSIWFGCLGAGTLPTQLASIFRPAKWRAVCSAVLGCAVVLGSGAYYAPRAASTYEAHPTPSILAAGPALKPYLENPGRFLLGGLTDDALLYSDHLNIPWWRHVDDQYIKYPIPGRGGDSHGQAVGRACLVLRPDCMYLEGIAGYRAAIHAHWFALISLIGNHGTTTDDRAIATAVEHTSGYFVLTRLGGAPTWIYLPDYRRLLGGLRP